MAFGESKSLLPPRKSQTGTKTSPWLTVPPNKAAVNRKPVTLPKKGAKEMVSHHQATDIYLSKSAPDKFDCNASPRQDNAVVENLPDRFVPTLLSLSLQSGNNMDVLAMDEESCSFDDGDEQNEDEYDYVLTCGMQRALRLKAMTDQATSGQRDGAIEDVEPYAIRSDAEGGFYVEPNPVDPRMLPPKPHSLDVRSGQTETHTYLALVDGEEESSAVPQASDAAPGRAVPFQRATLPAHLLKTQSDNVIQELQRNVLKTRTARQPPVRPRKKKCSQP